VSRFSGVGARLGLALFVVLAGALALVYLIAVPSLQNRLVNSRVSQVERAAAGLARDLPSDRFRWPDFLESASESANARIVVYDYLTPPSALVVVGDSRGARSSDVERDRLALRAAQTLLPASGTVTHEGQRFAEAATPVPGTRSVLLVESPLHEALATVDLVRKRLLLAGGLALLGALAVGYVGAWLFARRLRRLERAAERIAAGRFDEPIRDTGADEVGELARTFDRMRTRLAALDHARREFIANASHELRTPLFSLGGFLELLADEDLDDETHAEFLVTMREQVDRLAKLATELLDLSRADAGELRVESRPLELAAVAETVAEECSATSSACCRSDVRSSRTPSCTRRRERGCVCGQATRSLRSRTTGPESRRRRRSTSSSASTASTASEPRAAASGSRSPGSWPERWAARWSSNPSRGGRCSRFGCRSSRR